MGDGGAISWAEKGKRPWFFSQKCTVQVGEAGVWGGRVELRVLGS